MFRNSSYRNAKSADDFVPGGTTQNHFAVRTIRRLHQDVEIEVFGQLELWKAPILAEGRQTDLTAGLQLTFYPRNGWSFSK